MFFAFFHDTVYTAAASFAKVEQMHRRGNCFIATNGNMI